MKRCLVIWRPYSAASMDSNGKSQIQLVEVLWQQAFCVTSWASRDDEKGVGVCGVRCSKNPLISKQGLVVARRGGYFVEPIEEDRHTAKSSSSGQASRVLR